MTSEKKPKVALMVCTNARGGMRSVVEAYQRDGIFERWHFQSLWTHSEGSPFNKISTGLKAYFNMLGLLLQGKVSFMHVHAAMRGSFWRKSFFIFTARCFRIPCIMHLHGSEMKTFYLSLSPLGQRLVRWSLEHVEAVIVLSESWKKFVIDAAPRANIVIINNYVSLPKIVDSVDDQHRFKVLFLGILGKRKGIYDLLESWPAVLQQVPQAQLLIGGNGEVDKAHALAEQLGISNSVQFLGWIDGVKKMDLLKNADAFVLPSYNEGLPMSVLEAMSWEKPVITTRVGGIPELITPNVDGLLIEPGDQKALTAALIQLGEDLTIRKSIAIAGRKRVESSFSDASVLPKLEHLYTTISKLKRL